MNAFCKYGSKILNHLFGQVFHHGGSKHAAVQKSLSRIDLKFLSIPFGEELLEIGYRGTNHEARIEES